MTIKIGTRGSRLALWQANFVAETLKKEGIQTEIITIETKGDKITNKPVSKIGAKGVFTAEIEAQLLSGKIDIAVHSAKDMQSALPEGLDIIAYTERENPADVLISFNKYARLQDFDNSFVVGTSSTRRIALLRHYFPHVRTAEARGNLQTRMKKLEEGYYDALVLAYAGVKRMDYSEFIVDILPPERFTPPVGQGTIAIEASHKMNAEKRNTLRKLLNHDATEKCLLAERAFLKTLEGGCSIPSFGWATLRNEQISLMAGIVAMDGTPLIRETLQGNTTEAEQIGNQLAQQVLALGGKEILQNLKK